LTNLAGKRQNGTLVWVGIGSCQLWVDLYTIIQINFAEQVNDFACIEMYSKLILG
jgi:hypothetical protein